MTPSTPQQRPTSANPTALPDRPSLPRRALASPAAALRQLAAACCLFGALAGCGAAPLDDAGSAVDADAGIDGSAVGTRGDGTPGDTDAETSSTGGAAEPVPNISALTGPAPALFDCTSKGVPDTRLAAVPLGCVLSPTCTQRLVVGHRGVGGEFAQIAPENSLAAIRAALWMGQDGVELDVRHTADDQLVVLHDSTVDRTTSGTGSVSALTLAEATALKLKGHNGNDLAYGGDFTCERVPSLAEAFALTKGRLFVDLDTKTKRVDLVVAAIVAAGVIDEVFISVPDPTTAAKARALNPQIRVQVRPKSAEALAAALELFPERPPEVVEIPAPEVAKLAPLARAAGAKAFTNGFNVDALQLVLGEQGAAYVALFTAGCDIVQTEFPAVMLQALGRATAPR